jgi:hypothetical protein
MVSSEPRFGVAPMPEYDILLYDDPEGDGEELRVNEEL